MPLEEDDGGEEEEEIIAPDDLVPISEQDGERGIEEGVVGVGGKERGRGWWWWWEEEEDYWVGDSGGCAALVLPPAFLSCRPPSSICFC